MNPIFYLLKKTGAELLIGISLFFSASWVLLSLPFRFAGFILWFLIAFPVAVFETIKGKTSDDL